MMERRRALMGKASAQKTWIIKDGVLQSEYAPIDIKGYARGSGASMVSSVLENDTLKFYFASGSSTSGTQTGSQATQAIVIKRSGTIHIEGQNYVKNSNYAWPWAGIVTKVVNSNTKAGAYGDDVLHITPTSTMQENSYPVDAGTYYLAVSLDRNAVSGASQWVKIRNLWFE